MKSQTLCVLLIISSVLFIKPQTASAIVTKHCPELIALEYSEPKILEEHAIGAYEAYFTEVQLITGEFKLKDTAHSACTYVPVNKKETEIYKVVLNGTFRKGSANPATLTAHMVLPIQSLINEDIGDAIVYSALQKVSPEGIKLKRTKSKIFYQSADCTNGPCATTHIYLGTYHHSHAQ